MERDKGKKTLQVLLVQAVHNAQVLHNSYSVPAGDLGLASSSTLKDVAKLIGLLVILHAFTFQKQ